MITTIKRNDFRYALPSGLGFEKWTTEKALELVNSSERKLIINGFIVASQKEEDLKYIHDLFTNVRIKKAFINSIRFFVIEYATNYNLAYHTSEYERDLYFMDFSDLLLGYITILDVENAKKHFEIKRQKQQERQQSRSIKNTLKETRKRLASELLSKKISNYQTIKNSDGRLYYIVDGVLYHEWDLLQKVHKGLTTAKNYGHLITRY